MSLLTKKTCAAQRIHNIRPVVPRLPTRNVRVMAAPTEEPKSALMQFSDSIGLPTDEGFFGFKPFAEVWVGRWAMFGFVASIVQEFSTGKGTLQQLGLSTPSTPLLWIMIALFGGASVVGSVVTVQKLLSKSMSPRDVARYKNFLGLNKEDDYKAAAAAMKRRGDFTTPGVDMNAINAARAQGTPADSFLAVDATKAADAAAQEMKSAEAASEAPAAPVKPPRVPTVEERLFSDPEARYARDIELSNGRAAMLGFLIAVLVEAGNGKGIILQIIDILKFSGLLGAESGF